MRRIHLIAALLLSVIVAGGGWFAYRLWRAQEARAIAVTGVAPLPDLSRWSPEFVARLNRVADEVQRAPDPIRPLGELARLYQANGFWEQAAPAFQALHRLEPENPRWTYYLADARLKTRDRTEAEQLLKETARLAPDYLPALVLLAEMLEEEKRYGEARIFFERARACAPDDPRPAVGLAYLEALGGNRQAARQRLQEVLRQHASYAPAHDLLADVLERSGDRAGAEEHRRRARASTSRTFTASDPWSEEFGAYCYDANRLHMLAFSHTIAGRDEQALPFLLRATELAPNDAGFHDSLAMAYEALGRLDDARAALERGIEHAPQNFPLRIRLATVLTGLGRVDDALDVVQRALERWPEQGELHAARGHVLLIGGRVAEAVEAFRAGLARNPALTEAYLNLARCYLRLDRPDDADASLAKALEIRPDYPEALLERARLAILRRDLAKAEPLTNRLLELQPDDPGVRRMAAETQLVKANRLAATGDMQAAEQAYLRGIAADPTVPLLHAGLGMVYVAGRRLNDAIPRIERYVATAPDDPDAYMMLGNVLSDAGKLEAARKAYEQGLALVRNKGMTEYAEAFERVLGR